MEVSAVYGGGVCSFPKTAPGGTTKCTATENGFCSLDVINIDAKTSSGICICYPGYSGPMCASKDPPPPMAVAFVIKVFRFQRKTLLLFYCFFFSIIFFSYRFFASDFLKSPRQICMKFSGLM